MKKGFTLIELLAVIVILAIIAVIAVPIVLNIIDETKDNAGLRSAEMYIKAAEFSIAQSTLKDINISDGEYALIDGDICIGTLSGNECDGKILEVEVNGKVPESGTITITNGNISDLSIVLNEKTIVKNEEGELAFFSPVCTIKRQVNNKYTVGDEVTCGEEQFYVVEDQDNDLTEGIDMLAMYNLTLTESPIQDKTGANNEKYFGTYWYDVDDVTTVSYLTIDTNYLSEGRIYPYVYGNYEGNLVYPYVESYKNVLEINGVKVIDAKLLSYEQIKKLGCVIDYSDFDNLDYFVGKCNNAPTWIYSTNYWLGSVGPEDFGMGASDETLKGAGDIIKVFNNGYFGTIWETDVIPVPSGIGIRPVITIQTSDLG